MSKTHRVQAKDKKRILCQQCHAAPADLCEHVEWNTGNTTGISFFYYCDPCWAATEAKRATRESCVHGRIREICGRCRYPELYEIARRVARETGERINREVRGVKSEMRYKARFVLEEVIAIMTEAV